MKQKIKKTTKLVTLLLLILLGSCQKDLYENTNPNQYTIKEYTFQKAIQIPKFNLENSKVMYGMNKFQKSHRLANKSQLSEIIVDSTTVKEITLGDYTTYTMLVKPQDANQEFFDNLVIETIVSTQTTNAYIIRYDTSQGITPVLQDNSIAFDGGIENSCKMMIGVKGIDGNGNGSWYSMGGSESGSSSTGGGTGGYQQSCITIMMCNEPWPNQAAYEHVATNQCTHTYPKEFCHSTYTTPTGNTSSGSSSTTGPGSNSGSNTSNSLNPTSPVTLVVPPEPKPCEKLLELTDPTKANIKPNIDWLKTKVNEPTNDVEHGVDLEKYNYTGPYTNTQVTSPNQNTVPYSRGGDVYGAAHCHTWRGHSMFSFGDLEQLNEIYNGATTPNKKEVVIILVARTSLIPNIVSTYALRIDDVLALDAGIKGTYRDPRYINLPEGDKKPKILKDEGKFYDKCNNELEKSFLQQFASFGISLYKASDNLDNWSKLSLSPTDPSLPNAITTVNTTPCNLN